MQTEGGGALPERREELYDKAVEMLLTKWETLKVRVREDGIKEIEPSLAEWLNAGRDDIRRQLNRLAFEAHRDQAQPTGSADIRQETLVAALLRTSARRDDLNVGLLERYLRDRAGILAAHGEGVYQFPHRSFQEYLAACHLTDEEFPDKLAELARADPNRWREVTLLAGAKAARGSSLNAWALAETLCPTTPAEGPVPACDQWGGLLAGCVLAECADLSRIAARDEGKHFRVRTWQLWLLGSAELPATERALAGRSLAGLGDPRPEVMRLDDMQFCLVPPGPFLMGDVLGLSDETPCHRLGLAYPYFMARYPVTVAQWRDYLRLSGHPSDDDRTLRGRDNDPVVQVSWHEAIRFCAFLSRAWVSSLPPGFVVTLPSEAEWEKAARGGERLPAEPAPIMRNQCNDALEGMPRGTQLANPFPARAYPWGESFDTEKANVQSSIGETSAVGCYPQSRGPYGCEEMSGNVWEWTRSLWGKSFMDANFGYPYDPDDPKRESLDAEWEIFRVVRGGSWYFPRDFARCAFRLSYLPGYRNAHLGFRMVLRPVPVA